MEVKCGDGFLVIGENNSYKTSIYLKEVKDKRVTILARKGERSIRVGNNGTVIDGKGFKNRTFVYINGCESCTIEIIPTNLNKNRVYVEPIVSNQMRNILNRKFRRINN